MHCFEDTVRVTAAAPRGPAFWGDAAACMDLSRCGSVQAELVTALCTAYVKERSEGQANDVAGLYLRANIEWLFLAYARLDPTGSARALISEATEGVFKFPDAAASALGSGSDGKAGGSSGGGTREERLKRAKLAQQRAASRIGKMGGIFKSFVQDGGDENGMSWDDDEVEGGADVDESDALECIVCQTRGEGLGLLCLFQTSCNLQHAVMRDPSNAAIQQVYRIVATDTPVFSAPSRQAAKVATLHHSTHVTADGRRGAWMRISAPQVSAAIYSKLSRIQALLV